MSEAPTTGFTADEHGLAAPGAEAAPITAGESFDIAWTVASSAWIDRYVRNSPLAQSAAAWNHLGAALPQLKTMLETELMKR
jgi:hypothetical protein